MSASQTLTSLLAQIQSAKKTLNNVPTRIIREDGREMVERRDRDGFTKPTQIAVRPYGFIGDTKPDLQMAEVAPRLYLGSQDPAHDVDLLKKYGITHIVNLATNVANHFPARFIYMKIDIFDLPTCDILVHIPNCIEFMKTAIKNGGKVFCHCNAGVSRSATMVLAYIMKYEGLSLQDAFDRVRKIRPVVRPNDGFLRQLRVYEVDLQFERNGITPHLFERMSRNVSNNNRRLTAPVVKAAAASSSSPPLGMRHSSAMNGLMRNGGNHHQMNGAAVSQHSHSNGSTHNHHHRNGDSSSSNGAVGGHRYF